MPCKHWCILAHVLFACSASNRLNQYVSGRQDGMRRSQQQQAAVAFGSTAHPRSPSTSPGPVERVAGPPSPPGPLDPSFYRRQEALLQRRAELAAQRRESDEEDLTECTCESGLGLAKAWGCSTGQQPCRACRANCSVQWVRTPLGGGSCWYVGMPCVLLIPWSSAWLLCCQ